VQRICSTISPIGCSIHWLRRHAGLDLAQAPVEIAGLDRPDKGVDHQPRGRPAGLLDRPLANRSRTPLFPLFNLVEIRHRQLRRYRGRLARRDHGAGERRGNRLHHGGDTRSAFDRRSSNLTVRSRQGAAAVVAVLWEPVRRPAGLPDRPFSNGRPRTRPGGFGESPSAIGISSLSAANPHSRHLSRSMQC